MSLLVGFAPDGRGKAVLHLAGMLARSAGEDLVVCAVVPAPWSPSPARVDAEYQQYLQETANEALEKARARLPSDIPATFVVHDARSVPAGLLELAEQRDASLIVVGSSAAGGSGYVTLGSASSRLLLQLAAPGRHRAARLPLPAGRARDAGDRRLRRHRERGEPRRRGGERRGAGRRDAAARLVRGALARALHRRGRDGAPTRTCSPSGAPRWRRRRRPRWRRSPTCRPSRPSARSRRPRRDLGGGARRPRVGRRRRARRGLEHDRPGRARVPRLARREDRPPLPGPRRRRPARRGRGDRGGGEGGLAAAAQRDPGQRLADDALGDERRVVVGADARRDHLDDVGADRARARRRRCGRRAAGRPRSCRRARACRCRG